MAVSGQTIGYVGDGNNDAKSLKEVHVAFAPATTATSIAKECSGVLLM
jgi:Ca2+ transporting ATPase